MALIHTILGDLDESQLQRYDLAIDDDKARGGFVEYCLLECDGEAHHTGQPQGVGCFCPKNVHRSGHLTLKQGIAMVPAIQGF